MNRLLRRFGARPWDESARVEEDRASALPGNTIDESPASVWRAAMDQAERTTAHTARRVTLSGNGIDDADRSAAASRGSGRRWAAIGRGTPDFAAFDGYGRATSAEVGR